nr:MAG TPA: hypothetical protein [Caudoviricetes sp.]
MVVPWVCRGKGGGAGALVSESRGDHQGKASRVEPGEGRTVAVARALGDLCPLRGVIGVEAWHVSEEVLKALVVGERQGQHGQVVGGGVGQHEHGR